MTFSLYTLQSKLITKSYSNVSYMNLFTNKKYTYIIIFKIKTYLWTYIQQQQLKNILKKQKHFCWCKYKTKPPHHHRLSFFCINCGIILTKFRLYSTKKIKLLVLINLETSKSSKISIYLDYCEKSPHQNQFFFSFSKYNSWGR